MSESKRIVKTVSGKFTPRSSCVSIEGLFYEIGVDAFKIDNSLHSKTKYFKKDNPNLGFDLSSNKYVDRRVVALARVITGIDERGQAIFGETSEPSGYTWMRFGVGVLNTKVIDTVIAKELNIPFEYARNYRANQGGQIYDYTQKNSLVCDVNYEGPYSRLMFRGAGIPVCTKLDAAGTQLEIGEAVQYDPYKNVVIQNPNGDRFYALNVAIAESAGFKEDIFDGFYKKPGNITGKKGNKQHFHFKEGDWAEKNRLERKSRNLITENKPYTFGVEIETSIGYVPARYGAMYRFKCVRDGSLPEEGGEYISNVLSKDIGFTWIEGMCEQLKKRCSINANCSVHTHIGKVPCTKEFAIAMYRLGEKIQAELFDMLPYSRTDHAYNPKYGIKKNYCKPLPRLFKDADLRQLLRADGRETFKELISKLDKELNSFLLGTLGGENGTATVYPKEGFERKHNRKTKLHVDPTKWHRSARYYWLNLLNLNFDDKCTVEVRCHSGTTNYRKIKNWILISMALCYYAERKFKECVDPNYPITLKEIISFSYPNNKSEILEYIEERKERFSKVRDRNEMIKQEELEYKKDE